MIAATNKRKKRMSDYVCVHCQKTVQRESDKQWIASYCVETGKNVRLQRKSLSDRFEEKYIPEPNTGCWLWTGGVTGGVSGPKLYGVMKIKGKRAMAHRVAYELYVGEIPEGLIIDHLCRQPCCVNPDHLEPVTPSENILRGNGPEVWRKRMKEWQRKRRQAVQNA